MAWQNIKSTPKDGTVILLARFDDLDDDPEPDAAVAGHWAHWADRKGWYLRSFGVLNEGGAYFSGNGELSDNGHRELRPTHWMPLPEGAAMIRVSGGRALQWIDEALRDCLPPGVPPSYRSIDSARFTKPGKRVAEADVTMFDGQPGRVRVWEAGGLRAHQWLSTGDSPCSFEGKRWRRVDPNALEVDPDQRDLFAA